MRGCVAIGFVLLELVRRFLTTTSLDSRRPIFIFDVKTSQKENTPKIWNLVIENTESRKPGQIPDKRYFVGKETETSLD